MTQPSQSNAQANAQLEQAGASVAQSTEGTLKSTYDSTDRNVSGAQQAASSVYGSSRAVAG